MRLLLDTHALIWWLAGDPSLSTDAKAAIIDPGNEIFVSAVSAWEIATKYRIGRLPQAAGLALDVSGALASQGFIELPITVLHGQTAGCLPGPHRDPFDRMRRRRWQISFSSQTKPSSTATLYDASGEGPC